MDKKDEPAEALAITRKPGSSTAYISTSETVIVKTFEEVVDLLTRRLKEGNWTLRRVDYDSDDACFYVSGSRRRRLEEGNTMSTTEKQPETRKGDD